MKLSIIIPTLNEEKYITRTIQAALDGAAVAPEIIVVDSGSTDSTVIAAFQKGAKVIEKPSLKGKKYASLNAGAAEATGDVLLFLDADSELPDLYELHIFNALDEHGVIGGAFEFAFDKYNPFLRAIEFVNRVRYRMRQRYYGDQGIFVKSDIFDKCGGFPEKNILETAYFCKDILSHGELKLLPCCTKTSSRRFTEGGEIKVFANDLKIWMMDTVGLDTKDLGNKYWKVNQKLN